MARGWGGVFTYQPLSGLVRTFNTLYSPIRLALYAARFAFPSLRQYPLYSFRNSLVVAVAQNMAWYMSFLGYTQELDISPGVEGDRWSVVEPSHDDVYVDFLSDGKTATNPVAIGGTWTPSPPPKDGVPPSERVVLHFHGGGYYAGAPRIAQIDFPSGNLAEHIGRTFSAGYRLASADHAFPAAVQDAVTAYAHLVRDLGYGGSQIIICGDSAGGNLAIALHRYIEEFGENVGLPSPHAVLLFSPWVDLDASVNGRPGAGNPLYSTDFVSLEPLAWSAGLYIGGNDSKNPYISPFVKGYKTKSKMFINAGELEVWQGIIASFAFAMQSIEGNYVRLELEPDAPHNTFMLGKLAGFEKTAIRQVEKAAEFVK